MPSFNHTFPEDKMEPAWLFTEVFGPDLALVICPLCRQRVFGCDRLNGWHGTNGHQIHINPVGLRPTYICTWATETFTKEDGITYPASLLT